MGRGEGCALCMCFCSKGSTLGKPPLHMLSLSLQDVGMPAEYVNKLARMFQDIKVSEDLNTEFKEMQRGSPMSGD